MGAYFSVIMQVLAAGQALPGAIENTLLIMARLRRGPDNPRVPLARSLFLSVLNGVRGVCNREIFTRQRREPAVVHETEVTEEAFRDLAQFFQQQYDLEALVNEETSGWDMEMM